MRGRIDSIQQQGNDLVLSLITKLEGTLRWTIPVTSQVYITQFSFRPEVGQGVQLIGDTLLIESGIDGDLSHHYTREYHATFKEDFRQQ